MRSIRSTTRASLQSALIEVKHCRDSPGIACRGGGDQSRGKKIRIPVRAFDEVEEIGSGIHRRAVVNSAKFNEQIKPKVKLDNYDAEIFDRDERFVGRDYGGIAMTSLPSWLQTFIAGTGDNNPWYRDRSPLMTDRARVDSPFGGHRTPNGTCRISESARAPRVGGLPARLGRRANCDRSLIGSLRQAIANTWSTKCW